MDPIKEWWVEEKAKKAIEKLVAHDFRAIYLKTREEAAQEIWRHVTPGQKIGVGGSLTVRALGILEKLEREGYTTYDHWKPGLSQEKVFEIRKSQMTSDLFLGSSNAVTLNGELVNIDGIGNRVNSINFGPGKVILVAGYNKIVDDVQEGIKRIKNVAAPLTQDDSTLTSPVLRWGSASTVILPTGSAG